MTLRSLSLQHFRNYEEQSFSFSPHMTVISGQNARGKTNILEAIRLLSTGESFRASTIDEMVQWGNEVGRVTGLVDAEHREIELEVVVTTGKVQGKTVQKRKYLVDGVAKRKVDLVGRLATVLFCPEDMDLLVGSPSGRRKFLDTALVQLDREYRESLASYEKALRHRNALLDVLREGGVTRTAFSFWDQLMIRHGNVLTDKRRAYLESFTDFLPFPLTFSVEYDPSTISEHRLAQYAEQEMAAGYTLVGPHKDDVIVYTGEGLDRKDLAKYGSRGEQRMAVLWLKLGELDHAKKTLGESPILLLDDIFSELDEDHQQMVKDVAAQQQTIITTTEETIQRVKRGSFDLIRV